VQSRGREKEPVRLHQKKGSLCIKEKKKKKGEKIDVKGEWGGGGKKGTYLFVITASLA